MLLAVVVLATSLVGCGCSKKEFTVTFDSNGGTSVEAQTVEKDGTATKPTDPTREGYIFAGWELNGEEFDFATAITSDITLEAVWTEIDEGTKYTVSFNVDGDIETVEVTMGDTVDKPKNPTKKGYDFKGWYLDGKRYDFATPVIKDITLVAEFEKAADEDGQTAVAKKYTVKFNSNGGSSVSSQTVTEGSTVKKPSNPTRDGYTFVEWQLNGKAYNFNSKVTSNITLTAKWEKIEEDDKPVQPTTKEYTVKFDSNGGSSVSSQTVKEGSTVKKPSNPTRDGYTFVEWQLNGKAYNFNSKVTSNITLTAKWEKIEEDDKPVQPTTKEYTVKFDSNGGSSVSSQTVKEGSTVKKPSNPTRDGYTFVEWQLNGKAYDFNSKVTSNITLTAKWEKKADVYTLSFKKYDSFTPAGTIQVLKNGTVIAFSELLDANGTYVGKYSSSEKGMLNANEYAYNKVAKVKLADGTIVEITK